ncbi:MAG TPA: hypothetical protein VFM31_11020 [Nitrososphaeraceae archaeon]|nr:hypothetical protein [Nitrososphaeraceae archaeon]
MATILAGKRDRNKKVMSSKEISAYLEDIAKNLKIDLTKQYDDKEIEKIFKKMKTPLSDEILRNRGSKLEKKV